MCWCAGVRWWCAGGDGGAGGGAAVAVVVMVAVAVVVTRVATLVWCTSTNTIATRSAIDPNLRCLMSHKFMCQFVPTFHGLRMSQGKIPRSICSSAARHHLRIQEGQELC